MGQQSMGRVDVDLRDSFNRLRESHNLLAHKFDNLSNVGDIGALSVPAPFNSSLVGAVNFLFSQQSTGGVAMIESPLTECFIPMLSKLYFGDNKNMAIGMVNSGNVNVSSGDRTIMVFTQDGGVGIGKIPSYDLDVNGSGRVVNLVVENPSIQGSPAVRILNKRENNRTLGVVTTSHPTVDLVVGENSSNVRSAVGGGNFGIGVDSADSVEDKLHMKSLQPSSVIRMDTPSGVFRAGVENGVYQVGSLNNTVFTITQDNRVGINRLIPNYTLDVNGDARVSSIVSQSKYSLGARDIAVINNNDVNMEADNINVRKELRVDGFLIADGSGFTFQATTDQVTEESNASNLYFTTIRARAAIGSDSTFVKYSSTTGRITQGTLDDISEGVNTSKQFFSVSKARDVISSSSSYVSYNKTTGVISTSTADNITEGTTNKFLTASSLRNMLGDGSTVNFLNMNGSVRLSGHTTTQLANISGSAGDIRYNTTSKEPVYHDGIQWRSFLG